MTEQQNPASALETTTIDHPTPTTNPAEQVVPGDDQPAAAEPEQPANPDAQGSDWDEDDDHEDVGSSAEAPAGAADGDDLESQDGTQDEGSTGGNGS